MKPLYNTYRQILVILVLVFMSLWGGTVFGQDKNLNLDVRLIDVVQQVKAISQAEMDGDLTATKSLTEAELLTQKRLEAIKEMKKGVFTRDPQAIRTAIHNLQALGLRDNDISLENVVSLYSRHVSLLEADATRAAFFENTANFVEIGGWFERFQAQSLSEMLHSTNNERNAAMQKMQSAFSLIPQDEASSPYVHYAMAEATNTIAKLHNIQGNVDMALDTSLAYLSLPEAKSDPASAVDIVNNLIFSHGLKRDHQALIYLSEAILEIEKTNTSYLPGLSELRISQAMNASVQFEKGLDYANQSLAKTSHPHVLSQAKTNRAIALAGLGRYQDARAFAKASGINLEPDYLVNTETRRDALYLGFLLTQKRDPSLAVELYNRQLDVTSQKFLANNSRDTTAMLADLENSRERQLERDAASAQKAALQAQTIDQQAKLNRTLILLVAILVGIICAAVLIMKSRETLLRKLEIKTVEAASAEKLKTEFLGMISHELRTPLNGIIGISDFLANYHNDSDIREKTGIILRSGNELLKVVESLTDMARLDAGQLELAPHDADLSHSLPIVPNNWIEKAEAKGLTFTHFIDPKITEHHVDEERLVQCLNILLENAVRFTASGRVHLHVTGHDNGDSGVTGLTAIVADTGQGMSDLVQSRLFTPFMQADASRKRSHMGTGLSLAIAYALAEMMGGQLTVNSREGRGSEFKLYIPLFPAKRKANQPETGIAETDGTDFSGIGHPAAEPLKLDVPVLDRSDGPQREVFDLMQPHSGFPSLHDVDELVIPAPVQGRQHILVVDDMESNRDILRLILETQGHRCSEAADGFEALAMMDRQSFDVIVLDIHMTPMDGVETLRRLRGSGKPYADISVIALTADNAASTNAACMDAGVDIFLTKPVRQDELLRAINYLSQSETSRTLSQ